MYALTCPACNDVRHVPFVRPGAVTSCPACRHQWAIKERHVVRDDRNAASRPAAPAVPATPPMPPRVSAGDGLDDDPKGGSSVMGLSGLSDLMQGEPKSPPPVPPGPHAAAADPTPLGALRGRRVGVVVVGGVGVLLVVGLLLWALLGGGGAARSTGPAGSAAPAPAPAPTP